MDYHKLSFTRWIMISWNMKGVAKALKTNTCNESADDIPRRGYSFPKRASGNDNLFRLKVDQFLSSSQQFSAAIL